MSILGKTAHITPMIHVPDVRATADWYQSIGFSITGTNVDCGEMDWARVALGRGEVMFSAGGQPSEADRREVDLYVSVEDVEALRRQVDGRAEIAVDLYDSHYGMREFIIRDLNRFWITFGQPIADRREPAL